MNAITTAPAAQAPISFASAYRQLRLTEKAFVDAYVADVEADAHRRNERITHALHRPIPADVVDRSRGMLERPMVRAAITERINELGAASELIPQRIVKEWMNIGFASLSDYFEIGNDGHPYFDLGRCTPEQLSALQSVEIKEGRNVREIKIKLHDKLSALEKLGKVTALLEPDNHFYRQYARKPDGEGQTLPAGVGDDQAADAYSQMING